MGLGLLLGGRFGGQLSVGACVGTKQGAMALGVSVGMRVVMLVGEPDVERGQCPRNQPPSGSSHVFILFVEFLLSLRDRSVWLQRVGSSWLARIFREKLKAFLSGPGSTAEATLSSEFILIFWGALCPLSHSTT